MSNNINDVVDVTIAIESPATDSASFCYLWYQNRQMQETRK